MSETMKELIPIAVMYGFVTLLAPFIAYAMWIAFDGDREVVAAEGVAELDLQPAAAPAASPLAAVGASSAA